MLFISLVQCLQWGGEGQEEQKEKRWLCCNANEHIYKALAAMLSFSSLLLATLEDVLVAVAQKALSGLLYFLIWNTVTLFLRGSGCAAHKPVSVLYNTAARLILQCDYKTHHCELYSKLNWFPPSAKPEYYLAQIVYKCRNNTSPTYLNDRAQKAFIAHSISTFYFLLMTRAVV